jgi:prevent-host-death family protein
MADPVKTVNVQDAKAQLSRLLREVESGEEIVIARAGKAIAKLVRVTPDRPRRWGAFEGQVTIHEGALDPLDDDEASVWDEAPLTP